MKKILIAMCCLTSVSTFAKSIRADGSKPNNFLPNGATETVWESDCVYSMKAQMIFKGSYKNVDMKLNIYAPMSNCQGESIGTLSNSNKVKFKPQESITYKNTNGSWVNVYDAKYIIERGPVQYSSSSQIARILGESVQYFDGCIGTTAKDTTRDTCDIRGFSEEFIHASQDRVGFLTSSQFLLRLDKKIKSIRFSLIKSK